MAELRKNENMSRRIVVILSYLLDIKRKIYVVTLQLF